MKTKIIKASEIQPVGNFKEILEEFRSQTDEVIADCNKNKKYDSQLAVLIKSIVSEFAIIDTLENGIVEQSGWDMDEMMICLLYTHLIIIDLNQTAHTYLNNITKWDSPIKQLQDSIKNNPIYSGIKII